MAIRFGKDADNVYRMNGARVTAGKYRFIMDTDDVATATKVGISGADNYYELISLTLIENILKNDGTAYSGVVEFDEELSDFFVNASSEGGEDEAGAIFITNITSDENVNITTKAPPNHGAVERVSLASKTCKQTTLPACST